MDRASSAGGWFTRSLHSTLCLDGVAVLVEERSVVAARDSLTEVRIPVEAFPARRPGQERVPFTARVVYGAELIEGPADDVARRMLRLRLPVSLNRGRQHDLGLSLTAQVLPSRVGRHVYTCTQRCDRLVVRVRFGAARPRSVRLVDGIAPEDLHSPEPTGPAVAVDPVGEVVASFGSLVPGRSYGFRW